MHHDKVRLELRKSLLLAFADEHLQLTETWKTLESKAQSTITVAGIFLAAAFAYARDKTIADPIGRGLVALAILLLMASIIVALLALRLRKTVIPPLGTFTEVAVHDLIALSDDELSEEVVARFSAELTREWREAIRTLRGANIAKSRDVWISQVLLALSILSVAVVTVIQLTL